MMQRDALHAFSPPSPRESVATLGRILLWQTLAGLAFALATYLAFGSAAGSSALIGAAICVLPSVLFALRVAPGMFQDSPKHAMRGFYTAEAIKMAVTVLLFALVFRFVSPERPEFLFIGFIVTHFSMIFAAWKTD